MKKSMFKDCLVLGFALFAMFFGAGNLIFPAGIGLAAGDQWPVALLATVLASIIFPLLAVVAVAKMGNGYEDICRPVGHWYYTLTFFFCVVFIVILANLPRTAATTHEMSIAPFFPDFPIAITVVVYFAIALFLALDQSSLVDRIGKYMTPVLLILILVIVVKGFLTPLGSTVPTGQENIFGNAFIELYSTGDLYSGLMFATIFLTSLVAKGYQEGPNRKKAVLVSCVIAGAAFFVVYGGLLVIGAHAGELFQVGTDRTALLTGIASQLLGPFGTIALAISVALACLSTATALISMGADFFSGLTKGKVSYKVCAIVIALIGCVIGTFGVENIISFAGPAFLTVYPCGIAITFLGLFHKYLPNMGAYKYCVIFALVAGALDGLNALGLSFAGSILSIMPLSGAGFGWVLPTVVGFFVGGIKYRLVPPTADQ